MSSRDRDVAVAFARLAAACDGAIVGLALAAFAAASWVKYVAASAALRRISAAPSAPISGLRSLLDSSSSSSSEEVPLLVVVRGQVQPSPALEALGGWAFSQNNGALTPRGSDDRAVAILDTQTVLYNEWRGIFAWSFDLQALFAKPWKERRSCSLRTVPFVLVEGGNWPNSGYVHVNLDGSTHPLPLRQVHHELRPVQVTPYTFFQVMFATGFPVALLEEEKILPVGKEITAIGICRERDGAIEIKSCQELPCFLSEMTKDEIAAELSSNTRILFWSGIMLGTLSVGILGYALIRNLWRWREWRMRRRSHNEDLHNDAMMDDTMGQEDVPDGELCVICLQTRRRSAFIPCGHLVCCHPCAMRVVCDPSPKCPVCRQNVRSSIRIYGS
ncbi:E3 ubiquitin-protein ligase [Canna indica]|uniref:RING-type E3 ubiquitin transferase n=1 Tax=Canna indica TaxID=4628 RepID=A0AAQ3JR89_9LILI|nr:E3 ubiquitin-protein ligase [Canna indica]